MAHCLADFLNVGPRRTSAIGGFPCETAEIGRPRRAKNGIFTARRIKYMSFYRTSSLPGKRSTSSSVEAESCGCTPNVHSRDGVMQGYYVIINATCSDWCVQ